MLPYYLLPIPLALLAGFVYLVWDWRRHRAPLKAENPNQHYTLWHHIKVVTLPVLSYRFGFGRRRSKNDAHLVVKTAAELQAMLPPVSQSPVPPPVENLDQPTTPSVDTQRSEPKS